MSQIPRHKGTCCVASDQKASTDGRMPRLKLEEGRWGGGGTYAGFVALPRASRRTARILRRHCRGVKSRRLGWSWRSSETRAVGARLHTPQR